MKIVNRNARRNFQILEEKEAGVILLGPEVKSLRAGRADISEAFVKIKKDEAYLYNAYINPYKGSESLGLDARRSRKLLLHRRELSQWAAKVAQKGFAVVPISIYSKHNFIKVLVGLGKSKKKYEKRAELKKKAVQKEIERELREKH